MADTMIRKQVYLRRDHDRKIKCLAAQRGCTEAEVIREAIERLPEPEDEVVVKLRAAGLLAPKPADVKPLSREERERLDEELYAWLDSLPEPLGLTEALLEERRESPW